MPCTHMAAPANTVGIFVQACLKSGHESNFPQSHGHLKNSLPKFYMLCNLFLFPLLIIYCHSASPLPDRVPRLCLRDTQTFSHVMI